MYPYNEIIDLYYPSGSRLRDIYLRHCRSVADEAITIARTKQLPIPEADIEAAAMLHDIGIFLCDAPDIECHGDQPYIRHGILGAQLLIRHGAPQFIADIAERHTGAGLTPDDIISQKLPLEPRDYSPRTTLERLICYADKFYSKSGSMQRKPIEKVIRSMSRFSPDTLQRFLSMQREFS